MTDPLKIILIDVDNTLLNKEYDFTVDVSTLRDVIFDLRNKGFSVGLSSDSAINNLMDISGNLNLNGPIVAEKGASVVLNGESIFVNVLAQDFNRIRQDFVNELMQKEFPGGNLTVCVGSVNSLFKSLKGSKSSNTDSRTLVLINGTRESSVSFYCLEKQDEKWVLGSNKIQDFVNKLLPIAEKYYKLDELDLDINTDYGICIIHHNRTSKMAAVQSIKNKFPNSKIYMIGDSMSDFHDNSVVHCAVENATEEYKLKSNYVSKLKITEGVIDILKWICKQ